MTRKPAVAGTFYPGRESELRRLIGSLVKSEAPAIRAVAVVAPHAGFVYSGTVAGAVFASIEIPETVVVLAPSHRPIHSLFAIMTEGRWETPLGAVPVAAALAQAILDNSGGLVTADPAAHAAEHSLEVQLPFLQFLKSRFSLVPLAISYRASYHDLEALGRDVAAAVRSSGGDVLLVASTDMSHYVSRSAARELDFLAIRKIEDLDPRGLYDVVRNEDISMCGFQPVTAVLVAARELGATRAELVRYADSGDVTGDEREVVGYAGLRIF